MRRHTAVVAVSGMVCAGAEAQCTPAWLAGDGIPGVNGSVNASMVWDPDGAGSSPELLLVGGGISFAGDAMVNGVGAWNGERWLADFGLPTPAYVYSLGFFQGSPVVATSVSVYRWTGASWQVLGGVIGTAVTLAEFGGQLYAGGSFETLGANCRLARWNGADWQTVAGQPLASTPGNTIIGALLVDSATLLVGGSFATMGAGQAASNIARFDGTGWSNVGPASALNGRVYALEMYNGELHAGGSFVVQGSVPEVRRLARFNGASWVGIPGITSGTVHDLRPHGGELLVGGSLGSAAGPDIVRWDGSDLLPMTGTASGQIETIAIHQGDVVAGGSLSFIGGSAVRSVARWEGGTAWTALGRGFDQRVLALAEYEGDLVAGGLFRHAGGSATGQIARRTANGWEPMGSFFNGQVEALGISGGSLYSGGAYSMYNAQPVSRVTRWDGSGWVSVGTTELNSYVYGLAEHGGALHAVGNFYNIAGTTARKVARWTGSAWEPVGGGLGSSIGDEMYGMLTFGGDLVAYGRYTMQAPAPASLNIARYNGVSWQGFGAGLGTSANYAVYCAAVYDGVLHAGGSFTLPGSFPPAQMNVAKWDGTQWVAVGGPANGIVHAMVVLGEKLVAGGMFTTIGGVSAARIAEWDGQVWRPLNGGLDAYPETLLSMDTELVAGGLFLTAGGRPSSYLAVYGCEPCYANCDSSAAAPVLNVADFTCFLQRFAAGNSYANCDQSTAPPVLNVADFTCFLQSFAAGCP